MEDILVLILQVLFEFILEVFSYVPFDWPWGDESRTEPESIVGRCTLWFIAGCLLAGASLLVFRHTLIAVPALRVANLALAPVASAYLSQFLASRRASDRQINPRNHFWQAFWFTLGLVLIRFIYASRA